MKIKQRFPTSELVRATKPLRKIHIDLGGLLPLSTTRERFYLLIVNNYTRYV